MSCHYADGETAAELTRGMTVVEHLRVVRTNAIAQRGRTWSSENRMRRSIGPSTRFGGSKPSTQRCRAGRAARGKIPNPLPDWINLAPSRRRPSERDARRARTAVERLIDDAGLFAGQLYLFPWLTSRCRSLFTICPGVSVFFGIFRSFPSSSPLRDWL